MLLIGVELEPGNGGVGTMVGISRIACSKGTTEHYTATISVALYFKKECYRLIDRGLWKCYEFRDEEQGGEIE